MKILEVSFRTHFISLTPLRLLTEIEECNIVSSQECRVKIVVKGYLLNGKG